MALFQKKPQFSKTAPLYTFGLEQSFLIVGLGNPGKEYELTRHNAGYLCAEYLGKSLDLGNFIEKKDLNCQLATGNASGKRIIVIKPTTFMNLSGESLVKVMNFYKLTIDNIIVIHDELDIDFGSIRTKSGGGSAGHNGIKSIIQHVGEDFNRIRIGIKNDNLSKIDSADFVLQKFSKDEQAKLELMKREVAALTTEYIYGGSFTEETRSYI